MATKKTATKKTATKKRAPQRAMTKETPTAPTSMVAVPVRGPFTALRDRRIGPTKTGLGLFSREGCFVVAGDRALWGRPGADRVGWLSLDDAATFTELFACDCYANQVGTDGVTAVGLKRSQFVVLDPAKGKKPVRHDGASDHGRHIVLTPNHMLTIQDHETKKGSLHVWNRASGKLELVAGSSFAPLIANAWSVDVSASGHAVFFVEETNSIELWSPPWTKAKRLKLPQLEGADPMGRTGARAIGIASDGSRAAVLAFDAVYVVDLESGAVTRVATPSPTGSVVAESVRGHVYANSWVRPLPNDQLLVIDSTRWGRDSDEAGNSRDRIEVVVSLYDVGSGANRAVCHAVLFSDVDYSLAEGIAVGDDKVLLNRSRLIELC